MRESEVSNPGLFDGLTAWFSSSVQDRRKKHWLENDGDEASVEEAMFVFSEDANTEDTKSIFPLKPVATVFVCHLRKNKNGVIFERLYSSTTYLNDSLAIFHASYIDECISCGDMHKVTIGKYFLPPSEVYKKLGQNVKYCYEYKAGDGGSTSATTHQNLDSRTITVADDTIQMDCKAQSSSTGQFEEYIKIDTFLQVTGPINDFIAGRDGCHVKKMQS